METENKFQKIINNFLDNLEVLETYVSTAEEMIIEHKKNNKEFSFDPAIQDLFNLLSARMSKEDNEEIEKKVDELNSTEELTIKFADDKRFEIKFNSPELGKKFNESLSHITLTSKQIFLINKSSLINLAVYLELLINNLIRERLVRHPEALQLDKKTLTISEIKEIGSFEDAITYLIDKELIKLMYDGFRDWLNYFKNNMKVSLKGIESYAEEVNEVLNRRNLFVHGDGIVNDIYLSKVDKEFTTGISKGDTLEISKDYILNKIDIFRRFGLLLSLEVWKNMDKDSTDRFIFLGSLSYEMLHKKQWSLCSQITEFMLSDKLNEASKWVAKINYWLCIKRLGNIEKIKSEIEEADLSALTRDYQLAKMALLDENDKFFELLPKAFPHDITKENLLKWPILEEMREDIRFQEFIENQKSVI